MPIPDKYLFIPISFSKMRLAVLISFNLLHQTAGAIQLRPPLYIGSGCNESATRRGGNQ